MVKQQWNSLLVAELRAADGLFLEFYRCRLACISIRHPGMIFDMNMSKIGGALTVRPSGVINFPWRDTHGHASERGKESANHLELLPKLPAPMRRPVRHFPSKVIPADNIGVKQVPRKIQAKVFQPPFSLVLIWCDG